MSDAAGDADSRGDPDDGGSSHERPATSVPPDQPSETCPYCGFELPTETQYRLHLGVEHYGRLTEAEQDAFRGAYREEEDALGRFRIIALGGLVLLYFGFLLVYALLAT